jgi:hypothetical protein
VSHGVYRGAAMDVARGNIHRGFTLSSSGGIPPGVTFEDIMGGPTYYADNGFTYAVTYGFDDPDFFPIAGFLQDAKDQSDCDALLARGYNGLISVSSPTLASPSTIRSNDMWVVVQYDENTQYLSASGGSAFGSEVVGFNIYDEPTTYAEAIEGVEVLANIHQDNRFHYETYTTNPLVYGDIEGHALDDLLDDLIATPNATTRHLDLASVDAYWCSGRDAGVDPGAFDSGGLYGTGTLTNDQKARGVNYAALIDWMRLGTAINGYDPWQDAYPAPMSVWIETGSPYVQNSNTANRITPAELNAAAWAVIIHGARYLEYFDHAFGSAGEDSGMVAQQASTHALVTSLAGVINSPFALGYGSATSPSGGWKWGDGAPTGFVGTGVDTMVKYYNVSGGDNCFYLFAVPRYSPATTSQSVTFTIADTSATIATVINESRTVSITSGTFSDTFATGNTVHIYRIEN